MAFLSVSCLCCERTIVVCLSLCAAWSSAVPVSLCRVGTVAGKRKDWSAIERDIKKEEAEEKPEGEEALQKLFKQVRCDVQRVVMSVNCPGSDVVSWVCRPRVGRFTGTRVRTRGVRWSSRFKLLVALCCPPTGTRSARRTTRRNGKLPMA